jgi:murein DD-endopeptidase MepM/ murein hydrolase activator NlpD
MMLNRLVFLLFLTLLLLNACNTAGPGIFARKTPHEQYGQNITSAGLKGTALGSSWFRAAEQSLSQPLTISIPYSETGYFAAERPQAAGLRFTVKRGQQLRISLDKMPSTGFSVYLDLWESPPDGNSKPALVASADTLGNPLEHNVKKDAEYIVRVQPELLKGGEYTLSISVGPSLAFPIPSGVKSNIGSFWGAGRDGGARRHEGIDIFAPFRSPVVACADGFVSRVNENNLGGKVVFLRLRDRDVTLYYAHLDSQIVQSGQLVKTGDTLGLVGNTGNAKSTAPHLHFGIYAAGGAIDPIHFVNPVVKAPAKINAPIANLDKLVRNNASKNRLYNEPASGRTSTALELNSLMRVEAATAGYYRVLFPDEQRGFVSSQAVSSLDKPLRSLKLSQPLSLLDGPDSLAARKLLVNPGESVKVLANFSRYYYVSYSDGQDGWLRKDIN